MKLKLDRKYSQDIFIIHNDILFKSCYIDDLTLNLTFNSNLFVWDFTIGFKLIIVDPEYIHYGIFFLIHVHTYHHSLVRSCLSLIVR